MGDGAEQARQTLAAFQKGPVGGASGASEGTMPALEAAPSQAEESAPRFQAMELEVAVEMARETALTAIGSEEELDLDSPLMDMGLDSLSSIAFREQLIATSGLNVPSSLVFDYP